jgi:hypothetical protein
VDDLPEEVDESGDHGGWRRITSPYPITQGSAVPDDSRAFDPEQVLRDYAAVLIASDDPDANAWAAALMWSASRIHGGHQSIYAAREFVNRFGINPYPGEPA